jgi:outer membrane protein TolC
MRLEYYPDLNFRVGWGEMTTQGAIAPFADGVDSITTGLELNLPVRRARRAAAVAEAEARLVATGNRLEQVQDETIRDVRQVQAEDQRIADQLTLYRQQIVPPMEQAWQVTLSGYQVGQATFNDLITIRRQLIRLKQAETQLIVQQHSTRARLERLVPALTTGL